MTENEFTDAVQRNNQRLFLIALSFTKTRADAEDILQNAFMKLWKYEKSFENSEHIDKWLTRVTVNESKNHVKSSAFKYNLLPGNEKNEDVYTFENDDEHDLFSAVMRLPTKLRTVIHLFYYEDLSVREISDVLGIRESACKTRLSRGRTQIKEMLGDDWENE